MTKSLDTAAVTAFSAELRESLDAVTAALGQTERDHDAAAMQEAYRLIHGLKGAASMVGLAALSHLLHLAETCLEEPLARGARVPDDVIAAVRGSLPRFAEYVEAGTAGRPLEDIAGRLARSLEREEPGRTPDDTLRALVEIDRTEFNGWTADAAAAPVIGPPVPEQIEDRIEAPVLEQAVSTPAPALIDVDLDLGPSELSPELAEVFAQEAQDHLQTIARLTARLAAAPTDREPLRELRRAVHTLKGAAGVVGYKAAARLAHRMEDLLDRLYEGMAETTPATARVLASSSDTLDELITGTVDPPAMRATIARLFAEFDVVLRTMDGAEPVLPQVEAMPADPAPAPDLPPVESTTAEPAPRVERRRGGDRRRTDDRRGGGQFLRVPTHRVDDLMRAVSELVINRSMFEQHHSGVVDQVDELQFSAARLRRVAQRLESDYEVRALAGNLTAHSHGFDELEFDRYTDFHLLTRELAETASDIATIGARVGDAVRDLDGDLTRLGRLTREIQDKTMEFRMVPLDTLTPRLERAVRVTADACGKLVDFDIQGEHASLDKSLLEAMADPLLHLLRNAVDHGIEPPEAREARGKPARGRITVRGYHDGTEVVIEVRDDGRGLDTEKIRRAVVDKGLVTESDAATLGRDALHAFIFEPGFSTASHISDVSGRGVGMDVVKTSIARVDGRIVIDSEPGIGTTMILRVPMTLAITRVLMVRAGGETFGVPLGAIVQIVRPQAESIGQVGDEPVLSLDGRTYPLRNLADALGLPQATEAAAPATPPVMLVNLGGSRVALSVDQILHTRDAVVKSLGTHLRRVPGIWGATLLGDGTVVLILSTANLLGAAGGAQPHAPVIRARASAERRTHTVLVVDDSLSMRHVLTAAITRAGWRAEQARDGVEALEAVHRAAPDLVLLDIEMPRMDGFEFLSAIRSQPAYASLPVVMLTSRGGDKHRQKAGALGATDYMVKPFLEEALVKNIDRLIGATRLREVKDAS